MLKWIFWTKLAKKGPKQKSDTSPSNLTYSNSLGIKFRRKLKVLNFWTKLTPKECFPPKKEKKRKIINKRHH